jgi:hypothetical protein
MREWRPRLATDTTVYVLVPLFWGYLGTTLGTHVIVSLHISRFLSSPLPAAARTHTAETSFRFHAHFSLVASSNYIE